MGRRSGPLSECRRCAAPIRFVRLDTGKAMPVNPTPNPVGNVAARLAGGSLHGHVISHDHPAGPLDDRYVPHFATCEERPQRAKRPEQPAEPGLFWAPPHPPKGTTACPPP